MALTNFVGGATRILATWLNKVDVLLVTIFNESTTLVAARQFFTPVGGTIQAVEATPYATFLTNPSVMPFDNSIPQSSEGQQILTATITPTSATNRLRLEVDISCSIRVTDVNLYDTCAVSAAIFQDATAGALKADAVNIGSLGISTGGFAYLNSSIVFSHEMAAGTILATTFNVRVGRSATTFNAYINGDAVAAARLFGGVSSATFRVFELKA